MEQIKYIVILEKQDSKTTIGNVINFHVAGDFIILSWETGISRGFSLKNVKEFYVTPEETLSTKNV